MSQVVNAEPAEPAAGLNKASRRAGLRSLGILATGQAARSGGQLVTLRTGTSLLGPLAWGQIAEITSLATFFITVVFNPAWYYCARAFHGWQSRGTLVGALRAFTCWLLAAGVAVAAITTGVEHMFRPVSGVGAWEVGGLVGAFVITTSLTYLAAYGLNQAGSELGFAVVSSCSIWLGLGLALVCVHRWRGPVGWIGGLCAGGACCCAGLYWLFARAGQPPAQAANTHADDALPPSLRAAARFAWPQVIIAVLWWLNSDANRFLIESLSGTAVVGLYAATYQLAFYPVRMAELLVQSLCEPEYFRRLHRPGADAARRALEAHAGLLVPVILLTGIFAAAAGPFLARILVGRQFRSVGTLVVWVAIAEAVRGVNNLWYLLASARAKLRMLLLPVGSGGLTACIGSWVLTSVHPLVGPLIAMALASVVVCGISNWRCRPQLPFVWPKRQIGLALALGAPLIAFFIYAHHRTPNPSQGAAVVSLAVGGLYFVCAQLYVIFLTPARFALRGGWA